MMTNIMRHYRVIEDNNNENYERQKLVVFSSFNKIEPSRYK